MTINIIGIPVIVSEFAKHTTVKEDLLKLIDAQHSSFIDSGVDKISRTDWNIGDSSSREYMKYLFPYLDEHLKPILDLLKVTERPVDNYWFQQYNKDDTHGWHRHHRCAFNVVYYLELPDGCPSTEFLDPISGSTTSFTCKEGDIIVFPSSLLHRSPINPTDGRKTIIAMNIC